MILWVCGLQSAANYGELFLDVYEVVDAFV